MKIYWNMFTETGLHPPLWASILLFTLYTLLLGLLAVSDTTNGTKIFGFCAALFVVILSHMVGAQIVMEGRKGKWN